MSRIRSIKPEFPQSESIGRLSRDARLLFIQLWTVVDDAGRVRAASRMLASLLYPYDDDAPKLIGKWLGELEQEGIVRKYEVDGSAYLEIVKWLKHQKIDRPSPSRLPEFREPSADTREPSRALDADLGPRTLDQDQDQDSRTVATATRPKVDQAFDEFWKAYPRREGANPRKPALAVFLAKLKAGADDAEIVAGARACAARDRDKIGTPYIPQAVKWLRDERWRDYLTPSTGPPNGWRPGLPTDEELRAKYAKKPEEKPHVDDSAPADETAGGSDHAGELLREGANLHRDEQLGVLGHPRQRGTQSLGGILSRSLGLDAGLPQRIRCGEVEGDDDASPMAAVVRS